jgi:hypothetical protein
VSSAKRKACFKKIASELDQIVALLESEIAPELKKQNEILRNNTRFLQEQAHALKAELASIPHVISVDRPTRR